MLDKKFEEHKQVERLYGWFELNEAITRTHEMSMRTTPGERSGYLEHLRRLLEMEEAFFSTVHLPATRPLPD